MPGVRPDLVDIGLPVRATFVRPGGEHPDDLTLPAWRPTQGTLPDRVIDVTPTFVISSALATRDFQDVHHDRDRAVARGARDIFLNILTTTGLVQRYVCDWRPGCGGPGHLDPAGRALPRRRHADPDRPGHRGRRRRTGDRRHRPVPPRRPVTGTVRITR